MKKIGITAIQLSVSKTDMLIKFNIASGLFNNSVTSAQATEHVERSDKKMSSYPVG